MRAIICGLGEVGRHLARDFIEAGYDVVAIDQSADTIDEVEGGMDLMTLTGHAALPKTLNEAGAAEADLVVAVTDHDETNLVAALAAQKLGAKHTIARLGNRDYYQDHTGWRLGLLDVDLALCPGLLAGAEVVRQSTRSGDHFIDGFCGNLLQVRVTPLAEDAAAVGKSAAKLSMPAHCQVLSVLRDGVGMPPEAVPRLQPEDLVTVAGPTRRMFETDPLFEGAAAARGRALVIGGGPVGRSVAEELSRTRHHATIADRQRAKCEELSLSLDDVTVAHGDGTNRAFLEEIDARDAHIFVATTPQDEVNLMATLLAKQLQVPRAIALLHRPDYGGVFGGLGIDSTVSPRRLVSREVMRFVRRSQGTVEVVIPEDGSGLLELQVQAGSALVGQPTMHLDLPEGARVVALVRSRELVASPEQAPLQAGDVLLVFAPQRALAGARRVLGGRRTLLATPTAGAA